MEENVPSLPQELVQEILIRLPCKSLMRFKCVCKHWNFALFHKDTKFFLSRHVSHHIIKNQNSPTEDNDDGDVLLKVPYWTNGPSYRLFSLSATMEIPIPIFKSGSSDMFHICGHSNGILCLSYNCGANPEVLLYNPVTTEFRHLPDAIAWWSDLGHRWSPSPAAVGMGYDTFTDDFKVIRIWSWRLNVNGCMYFAEQYTLSTDSWTMLHNSNAGLFSFPACWHSFALCFKRTFYWWAVYERKDVILALNMDDDGVFQMVPLPLPKPPLGIRTFDIGNIHERSLTVWNGSIWLICCTPPNVGIWVMAGGFGNGNGNGTISWTPMRSIKPYLSRNKPLVFWKENELLMRVSHQKLKSYNVDTQEIKNVLIKKGAFGLDLLQAVNYVPSLVTLKGEII